jgi:phosphatidylglycerophosphatase A
VNTASLIATVGGVGRIRPAPGTWGSLVTLPFAWAASSAGVAGPVALSVAAFIVGWLASESYIRNGRVQDPPEVVIDEVAGQALTLAFAPMPLGIWGVLAGFIAFRFFDIVKPWPVSYVERKLPGGLGIMADDIAAALMGGIVILLARSVIGQ